jgi:rsbT co-antagonist protein RsbR
METGEQPTNPLLDQRDALVEKILHVLPTAGPFYAALSAEVQHALVGRIVDFCLASLIADRTETLGHALFDSFSRRREQGVPLAQVARALGFIRKILSRAARGLEPAELAEQAIERFESVFTDLLDAIISSYEASARYTTQAFAQLEARYRAIYQRTPAMMHTIDAERQILAVSNRWLEMLEYTADEVLGRRSADFLTEESRRRADEIDIPRLFAADELLAVPCQLITKSGKLIDVRASTVVVRDEHGAVQQVLSVFEDVTAELEATRALRESEERWRVLIDLSPLPLSVHRDGILVWVNDATVRQLGATSPAELIGRSALEFVHPDDRAMVLARVREGQSSDEPLPPMEERYVRLDGAILHVEVAARSVMFQGQRATQTATIDITARRQAEEARHLSELQARIIEAQEESLRALSTPLIPLGEGILVLPLIGRVNVDRAEHILETLAQGVVTQRASVAIVDVTGVPEADTFFAEALVRVAKSIRLLGADVIITGMSPSIARTLVSLGADFARLTTCGTLRDGIAHARGLRRGRFA